MSRTVMSRVMEKGSDKRVLLLMDQAVSSASNAVALLCAAIILNPMELTLYSLLQLVSTSVIAFQRSLLIEPSLATSINGRRADPYGRWALFCLFPGAAIAVLLVSAAPLSGPHPIAVLCLALPVLQDLYRYRCMSLGRVGRVLASDVLWLLTLVIGILVLRPTTADGLLVLWGGTGGLCSLLLICRGDARPGVPLAEIWALGRFQITEWAVDMMTSVAPLLLVNAALPTGSVGAFRLAQTMMGPLNTLSSYVLVRFLLNAEVARQDARVAENQVSTSVRNLVSITFAYGLLVFLGFWTVRPILDPELVPFLVYAIPSTVLSAVITSPTMPYLAFARALSLQRMTVAPKVVVMSANLATTLVGIRLWEIWHIDPLVLVNLVTAVTTLLCYRAMYRKARRKNARPAGPKHRMFARELEKKGGKEQ